jgi:hypothetical protein
MQDTVAGRGLVALDQPLLIFAQALTFDREGQGRYTWTGSSRCDHIPTGLDPGGVQQ